MNYSAIAVRYSKALFALALERNILDEVKSDIEYIYTVCQTEPLFIRMLEFPVIPASKKIEIFRILFEERIKAETLKFLTLIAEKRRESYLPAISYSFIKRYKEREGIKTVVITSVTGINDAARQLIRDLIQKRYNSGTELVEKTDERIIGGFILRIEDEQYDASVLNQLEKIKQSIKQ
jgi:F-type H+-transporting ATPase subunit delta